MHSLKYDAAVQLGGWCPNSSTSTFSRSRRDGIFPLLTIISAFWRTSRNSDNDSSIHIGRINRSTIAETPRSERLLVEADSDEEKIGIIWEGNAGLVGERVGVELRG